MMIEAIVSAVTPKSAPFPMPRLFQCLLILPAFLLAWLLMQAVHELGHALAAWASGGTVERVVLHPLAISRADVEPNPHPLVVVWAGPIVGVVAPALLWGVAIALRSRIAWPARFFAGFCLLANGLYIGVGSFHGIGDAGEMLGNGSPHWTLWLFSLLAVPAGLALWNGLGSHFGIGRDAPAVDARTAIICTASLIAFATLEWLIWYVCGLDIRTG